MAKKLGKWKAAKNSIHILNFFYNESIIFQAYIFACSPTIIRGKKNEKNRKLRNVEKKKFLKLEFGSSKKENQRFWAFIEKGCKVWKLLWF